MQQTKLLLMEWFWAAYLMSQDRQRVSALHVTRELNLHYATAWTMLHKFHRSLACPGENPLQGVIGFDETYYGGKGSSSSDERNLTNVNLLTRLVK